MSTLMMTSKHIENDHTHKLCISNFSYVKHKYSEIFATKHFFGNGQKVLMVAYFLNTIIGDFERDGLF